MKTRLALAGLAALIALAGCGRQPRAGGLSADEESQLDNAAAMLDDNNVFDASPDSLVANEAEIAAEENGAGGNEAAGNAE
jgi:hypothetical protein